MTSKLLVIHQKLLRTLAPMNTPPFPRVTALQDHVLQVDEMEERRFHFPES